MIDDRRKAYNKTRYAYQKEQQDALKRFQELYPERYAELVAKVKAEMSTPSPTPTFKQHSATVQAHLDSQSSSEGWTTEQIDAIVYDPHERHIFITTQSDKLYCESITYPNDNVTKAMAEVLDRRHPYHSPAKEYYWCECPACLRRHPNE